MQWCITDDLSPYDPRERRAGRNPMVIESLRALILEGSGSGVQAIAAELRAAAPAFHFQAVDDEPRLRAALSDAWDVVVADYALAALPPVRALAILREKGAVAPLIVIGDSIGEEAAAMCVRNGAADFLLRSNLPRLARAIQDALQLRRQRQEEGRAANLEVAQRLAAGVGHEFNNLLTVMGGYSGILVRQPQLPAPVKDKLKEIDDAARRASQLTGQLLAFARKHIRQPGVLDLHAVLAGMEPLLKSILGPAVELRLRFDPDLGLIHADHGEIEQLIMNLALNGRDAMSGAGALEIEAGRSSDGQVEVSVTDHGCGMTPETQARIFEPFFTTKKVGQGIGMGLSIVYGIVNAIGGRIEVESSIDHGSTMRVLLPRFDLVPTTPLQDIPIPDAAPEPRADIPAGAAPRETILVVEDQNQLRSLIVSVLEPIGFNVLAAANAGEAIELCGAYGQSIDVLLTDVQMPDITGVELAEMIQENYPWVKTIYMSGSEGHGLAAQAPGQVTMLRKPFTPKTLVGRIREALDCSTAPSVLVVDDDAQIRNLLRHVLGEAGYRVEEAAGGRQALERVNQKTPDLLITDLIMPEVEGMETITRIRKIAPSLKIIAMSGSLDSVYLDTARVLGASATFSKPLQLEALLAAVSGLLQPDVTPAI